MRWAQCVGVSDSRSLEDDPAGAGLDTADTDAGGDGDAEVTLLAPVGAPGVLGEPVSLAVFAAVAHEGHGVVQHGAIARLVVVNAARVELERLSVSIKGGSNGLVAQGLLHHIDVATVSESVSVDLAGCSLGLIVLALVATLSVASVVRVVLGSHGLGGLEVVEGLSHGAALAAGGLTSAVKSLLDREGGEFALLHTVGALKGTDGGESPVRAAHALAAHIGNEAVLSPVDRGGNGGGVGHPGDVLGLLLSGLSVAEQVHVLVLGPVGEFVVANLVMGASVPRVSFDEIVALLPLPEAELELDLVNVALAEVGAVLNEAINIALIKLSLLEFLPLFGEGLGLLLALGVVGVSLGVLLTFSGGGLLSCRLFFLGILSWLLGGLFSLSRLISRLIGRLVSRLVSRLVTGLVTGLVSRLVSGLVSGLVGGLVGRFIGGSRVLLLLFVGLLAVVISAEWVVDRRRLELVLILLSVEIVVAAGGVVRVAAVLLITRGDVSAHTSLMTVGGVPTNKVVVLLSAVVSVIEVAVLGLAVGVGSDVVTVAILVAVAVVSVPLVVTVAVTVGGVGTMTVSGVGTMRIMLLVLADVVVVEVVLGGGLSDGLVAAVVVAVEAVHTSVAVVVGGALSLNSGVAVLLGFVGVEVGCADGVALVLGLVAVQRGREVVKGRHAAVWLSQVLVVSTVDVGVMGDGGVSHLMLDGEAVVGDDVMDGLLGLPGAIVVIEGSLAVVVASGALLITEVVPAFAVSTGVLLGLAVVVSADCGREESD
mmetsp:Transcript_29694/g.39482  ORF Transcript_29694/g.39482 Transcript_29694/m.39482 type:complete len:765 (+) Transcript_29694:118-2412(+)